MSSDSSDKRPKPHAIGLKYVPGAGDQAIRLGSTPETVREEIDLLFNVLASGEYEARTTSDRPDPRAVRDMVQNVLEASGKFRAKDEQTDELVHQARNMADMEAERAKTKYMLQTLVEASRHAMAAGAESPEATAIKQILADSKEKAGSDSGADSLEDLYRSFLRESVSLLETRKGKK